MKKFIFILTLFSLNTFAQSKTACSEDDLRQFTFNARNEILQKPTNQKLRMWKDSKGREV